MIIVSLSVGQSVNDLNCSVANFVSVTYGLLDSIAMIGISHSGGMRHHILRCYVDYLSID